MIKIDLATGNRVLEMEGLEPLVYCETGEILSALHKAFMENRGKEYADTMIKQLCKDAMLSREEKEKKVKEAEPFVTALTDVMYERIFGGKPHEK